LVYTIFAVGLNMPEKIYVNEHQRENKKEGDRAL